MLPGMSGTAYTVIATFPDERTSREYIDWLRGGHLDQVLAGGAESAIVVQVVEPSTPIRVEVRYRFATRGAYQRYVDQFAPALRAEGARLFGGRPGVAFERTLGEVV
jgi:hypothetical protein